MPKLRYSGPPIRLWNGDLVKSGAEVQVTEQQAAELLAVYPSHYEEPDPADPKKTRRLKHPQAGKPVRPGWERVEPQPRKPKTA